ncbi:MAG: hypothetical protein GEV28_41000 [Actinophytocola sp.]|nr:hypothetical protein [Actinophytocola sp.]
MDNVRRELAVAAEAGDEETRALAERLTAPLASAIRLTLLDALAAAADEITRDLAPGSVEVRLRAGDAAFAVTPPAVEAPATPDTDYTDYTDYVAPAAEPEELATSDADGAMVRINLRLPENIKTRVEEAAAAERRSVNAWLVRAAAAALKPTLPPAVQPGPPKSGGGGRSSAQRYTGWVS